MKILSTNIYCQNQKCMLKLFSDGGLIWSPRYSQVYQLNNMACFILKHSDGRNSVNSIISIMAKEFNISENQARSDTLETYGYWIQSGIIDLIKEMRNETEI
jgi:hypothetical protein